MALSKEFIGLAMRTNSDKTGTFAVSPDLVHAVLGINSEVFEFLFATDKNNAFEELGDLMWFGALFTHATRIGIDTELSPADDDRDMVDEACQIIDILKAMYAYGGKKGKTVDDLQYVLAVHIGNIIRAATVLYTKAHGGYTYEKVMMSAQELVINKLKARYPDKFTTDHAQNRDLGYENEVIASSVQ